MFLARVAEFSVAGKLEVDISNKKDAEAKVRTLRFYDKVRPALKLKYLQAHDHALLASDPDMEVAEAMQRKDSRKLTALPSNPLVMDVMLIVDADSSIIGAYSKFIKENPFDAKLKTTDDTPRLCVLEHSHVEDDP